MNNNLNKYNNSNNGNINKENKSYTDNQINLS